MFDDFPGAAGNRGFHSRSRKHLVASRYQWAEEAMQQYREHGIGDREALQKVAMDLGHGDGRGRYMKQMYYQNRPAHQQTPFPSTGSPGKEFGDLDSALGE